MFEDWRRTTLLLGLYGLFKEIRPIEPFLNEYLINRQVWGKNLNEFSFGKVGRLHQPHSIIKVRHT